MEPFVPLQQYFGYIWLMIKGTKNSYFSTILEVIISE